MEQLDEVIEHNRFVRPDIRYGTLDRKTLVIYTKVTKYTKFIYGINGHYIYDFINLLKEAKRERIIFKHDGIPYRIVNDYETQNENEPGYYFELKECDDPIIQQDIHQQTIYVGSVHNGDNNYISNQDTELLLNFISEHFDKLCEQGIPNYELKLVQDSRDTSVLINFVKRFSSAILVTTSSNIIAEIVMKVIKQ